jgi:transposase
VITIPRSVRILIGSTPIDMRKSIDGLMAIVQEELQQNAYSGHLFVFVSRRRDRVKILTWDKGGFVLLSLRRRARASRVAHRRYQARRNEEARINLARARAPAPALEGLA